MPDEDYVERTLGPDFPANGGFPQPPAGEPVRVVAARHPACGTETRVRLPGALPAGVVRRVRCSGCEGFFSTDRVEDLGVEGRPIEAVSVEVAAATPVAAAAAVPRFSLYDLPLVDRLLDLRMPELRLPDFRLSDLRLPDLRPPYAGLPPFDPETRFWRLASIPIAALAVIAALLLIQGGGGEPQSAAPATEAPAIADDPPASGGAAGRLSKDAKLVRGSSYSLALPAGWEQVRPEGGATFAAVSGDGAADATLWIERDPKLDFPSFIARSLDQLRALAGSAQVVERVPAPTPEATIVRLAADAPAGQPSYEVTLRAAGQYRYYLATSVAPDGSAAAVDGAELVAGSFSPDAGGAR